MAVSPPCSTREARWRRSVRLLFLRPRRSLARWQRGDVGRDRLTVGGGELRGVADDFGHAAARIITGRIHAVGEEARDIFLRPGGVVASPMLQASWRDVGDEALAVRRRPAGKALALDDGAKRVARAVAFGAMARTVDQISASVPLRRLRRVRHERAAMEVQKLPQADQPANVERKPDLVAVR